jgi:hypothetical protein
VNRAGAVVIYKHKTSRLRAIAGTQRMAENGGSAHPKFFVGLYLGNGEELNMRYSNHYCCPWVGDCNGILQFDFDPIFKVKFRKFAKMPRKHCARFGTET